MCRLSVCIAFSTFGVSIFRHFLECEEISMDKNEKDRESERKERKREGAREKKRDK